MAGPQIQPHLITKPIQLTGTWMWGLVALVGLFLAAARFLTSPGWLPAFLAVAAAVFVLLFVVGLFLLQTKFRRQLLDDPYFVALLVSQAKRFEGFQPENLPDGKPAQSLGGAELKTFQLSAGGGDGLEETRVGRYRKYQGVFLVHSWRPSRREGQVADVVLDLRQHGDGPLSAGQVDRVEYELGRKFFPAPVAKRNAGESFRLEVSAYSPMLCVARVYLRDGSSFELERYIDFDPAVVSASAKFDPSGASRFGWDALPDH